MDNEDISASGELSALKPDSRGSIELKLWTGSGKSNWPCSATTSAAKASSIQAINQIMMLVKAHQMPSRKKPADLLRKGAASTGWF